MGKEEDYQKLINDPKLEQATATFSNLNEAITTLLASRETTIRILKRLKRDVEESYDKSRKARIGGTCGTVVGSVLAITGFGLSFVTFGTSLVLTIAGTTLAAGGGITIAGADIGYLVVSQQDLKRAQEALDVDREMMEKAKKLQKDLIQLLDSLVTKYPTFQREDVLTMVQRCWQYGNSARKVVWSGYKLVDGVVDVGKAAVTTATSIAKTGARAGQSTVWAGLSTASRVAGVVGVVFDAAFIPVDLGFMIKA